MANEPCIYIYVFPLLLLLSGFGAPMYSLFPLFPPVVVPFPLFRAFFLFPVNAKGCPSTTHVSHILLQQAVSPPDR